jgi:TonB-dependent starch-binding outer membrane protein SusC
MKKSMNGAYFPDLWEIYVRVFRIMRITVILLLFGFSSVFADSSYSQNTQLSIHLKNGTMKQFFEEIQKQSEFIFFYKDSQVDLNKSVNIDLEKASVQQILEQALINTNLGYEIFDRQIVILPEKKQADPKEKSESSLLEQPQKKSISGHVTDSSGGPLLGVSVVVKGTTTGTITDSEGNFSLQVPSDSKNLKFSFVGMKSQEIAIAGKTSINVVLEDEPVGIDEVVAVGYGTMKRSDLTGSIASVKSEQLNEKATSSIESALQGRVPGVQIKTTSASPGGSSSIVIRGGNSINSSIDPLYVVDGFPMSPTDATLISPQDIESIEILKDASSTAIYGSRGANGVVLISTKRGTQNETKISYSVYTTVEKPYNTYDFVNAEEFATLYDEGQVNKGVPPVFTGVDPKYPKPSDLGQGTNWFDELTRNGFIQSHQLSVLGGTKKTSYRFSANYLDQNGVMINDDFTRGSLSVVIDSEINNWLKAGISLTGYKHERNIRSNVSYVFCMYSFIPVYDDAGNYNFNYFPDNQMADEYPLAYSKDRINTEVSAKINGIFYLEAEPIKGLKIKSSLAGFIDNGGNYQYLPTTTQAGRKLGGAASISNSVANSYLNDNILTCDRKIGIDHRLSVMAGYSRQYRVNQNSNLSGSGFTSDKYTYNNIGAASSPGIPGSNKNKWQLASYLGRVNYVFKEKYLFSATARADGCSKFGADNRWAFFPSAAFAWRASEEEFMNDIQNLTNLKFRLSYGETGNSDIGLYQSQGLLGSVGYVYGDARVIGVAANRVVNPDLKWETTKQYDFGFDLGLFRNRLSVTSDLYYKKTTDLLLDVNINATSGYINALKNVGALQNVGVEFSANVKVIDRDFKWDVIGNISINKNKITKLAEGGNIVLAGGGTKDIEIIIQEGQPIGQFRGGAAIAGIFHNVTEIQSYINADGQLLQPTAVPGDIKYKDTNGDGIISGEDWEILGNSNPNFIYSLNSTMNWRNFTLDFFFNGVYGNQIFNATKFASIETDITRRTLLKEVLNRWTPENPDGIYPRMGSTGRFYAVEDGSYLKLSNIKLNYTVPGKLFNIIQNLNVYVSLQNVFTLTKYSGFDPDINSVGNSSINFGTDNSAYPNPRQYTLGLNVTF